MPNNPSNEGRRGSAATQPQTPARTAGLEQGRRSSLARREPFGFWGGSPFSSLFQRWSDDMDRLFEDFGFGSRSLSPARGAGIWSPQVEVFQRGNDLIVRADLPGLSKDDVRVQISDDVLTIEGERKQEHEEEREGGYRSELSYGRFSRTIPLPEGTIADSAKATFKNGVLEIVLQAPPQEVSRGRRLEISEG
jgi:HSP20 family protein